MLHPSLDEIHFTEESHIEDSAQQGQPQLQLDSEGSI